MLTNMRGLYSDVIAEHVLGMMLCFTRNLHRYIRNQASGRWDPAGGEHERVTFATGPGVSNAIDRAHANLGDLTLGIVGLGSIGLEIARHCSKLWHADRGRRSGANGQRPTAWPRYGLPSACTTCWPRAISWSSPRRTRPRPSNCFAARSFRR